MVKRLQPKAREADQISDMAVNLAAAILVWLFGILVFLPIADRIDPTSLKILCSLIIFVSISVFISRSIKGLETFIETSSTTMAQIYQEKRKNTKWSLKQLQVGMQNLIRTVIIFLSLSLYTPLLTAINPSLTGIALILTILYLIWIFFKTKSKLTELSSK
jgi:hypothetical protein